MKKAGIITIVDNTNYGNRLQNYAMQILLNNVDIKTKTIRFSSQSLREDTIAYIKCKLLSIPIVIKLRNSIKHGTYTFDYREEKLKNRRVKNFKSFNEKYICFYPWCFRKELAEIFDNNFDYFVVGSDQIWNPNSTRSLYITYLDFAKVNKRIAIAPSFGVDVIPSEKKEIIRNYLLKMKYISVREKKGVELVESLIGKKCDVIMDPTLMVETSVWKKLINDAPIVLTRGYVLTYFLGEISEKRRSFIQNYANERNLKIINLNCKENIDIYSWGPEMFLKAIYDCEILFTDSFHGCVFSVLFHKQFLVFRREGSEETIFGRIEALLNTLGLENREYRENKQLPNPITEKRYKIVDDILVEKRVEVNEILRNVFNEN